MKFKKDITWLVASIVQNTKITFKDLTIFERYFLEKCSRKISNVRTKNNADEGLKGQQIDTVFYDEI